MPNLFQLTLIWHLCLRSVFMAVENGDIGLLKSLGIKDSELGDVKFFLEKLVNTGFLD